MLSLILKGTKDYGTYGVSLCATYFLANGYRVLLPYGDSGHYDLAVEKDGIFQRIQCKWTTRTRQPQGYPIVTLRVSYSPKRENGRLKSVMYKYTLNDFDLLWVTTPSTCYLIPLSEVLKEGEEKVDIKLFPKWDKYRIAIPVPFPYGDSPVKRASPRLTTEDKAVIKRLRKEGKSQQEIADILQVTRSCIEKFLLRDDTLE